MIEIIIYEHSDGSAHGRVYVNDIPFCDCLINHDKYGRFPYVFDTYYFLESHPTDKWRLKLYHPKDLIWSQRGFQIHTGNTLKDSEGCVLVGLFNNPVNDHNTLYLSKDTFLRFVEVFQVLGENMVKFRKATI